jgi:hypothetical protein
VNAIKLPTHRFAPNCSSLNQAREFSRQRQHYAVAVQIVEDFATQAAALKDSEYDYCDAKRRVTLLDAPMRSGSEPVPADVELAWTPQSTISHFKITVGDDSISFSPSRDGFDIYGLSQAIHVRPAPPSWAGAVPEGGVKMSAPPRPAGLDTIREAQDFRDRMQTIEHVRGIFTQLAPQVLALDGSEHDYNPAPHKIVVLDTDEAAPTDASGAKWSVDLEYDQKSGEVTFFSAESAGPNRHRVHFFGNGWYKQQQRFAYVEKMYESDVTVGPDGRLERTVPSSLRLEPHAEEAYRAKGWVVPSGR